MHILSRNFKDVEKAVEGKLKVQWTGNEKETQENGSMSIINIGVPSTFQPLSFLWNI